MFSRLFVGALALVVATSVAQPLDTRGNGDCNVGELHCCDSATSNSGHTENNSAGLLTGILTGVIPIIPVTCVPISVLGLGTINCNAQTVCCENSEFNGISLLSCTPVNVAL